MDQKQELTLEVTLLGGNKEVVFQINKAAQSYTPDLSSRQLEVNIFISSPHLRSRAEWHGQHHDGCKHSFPDQSTTKFTTSTLQAQLSVLGNKKELKDLSVG